MHLFPPIFIIVTHLGVAKSSLSRLQLVQNAATRLLTGTKSEHILLTNTVLSSRFCCMCIRGEMARLLTTLQIFFSTGNVLGP